MRTGKIDTHHHYFPKVYVDAIGWDMLAAAMPNGKAPDWSVQAALDMMDVNGIGAAILSVSAGPRLPHAPTLPSTSHGFRPHVHPPPPRSLGLLSTLPLPVVHPAV